MNFTNKNFHQGDTEWFSISEVPAGAKRVEKQFVAASERSGSFHALFGKYDQYTVEGGFVIEAHEECVLNHSLEKELRGTGVTMDTPKVLPKKDHRHTIVPPGVYFVGIQQRFDPLSAMKKRVID